MFAECPRAFYWYGIGSAGGELPDAPPRLRELYLRRYIQWSHHYARNVVSAAMRDFFYRNGEPEIAGPVLRRLARDRRAAARGEPGEDGRFPMWMDPENVTAAVNDLLGSPFLPDLLKKLRLIRPIDRIRLPEPCASELAGVRLTAAPILAWREDVDCRFLTFESHESVDTVLCRYALERLKLGPDRVHFLRWDGREEPAMRLDFSAELDHIAVSAARMYNGDYPKTADRAVCARCRYRDCCDG